MQPTTSNQKRKTEGFKRDEEKEIRCNLIRSQSKRKGRRGIEGVLHSKKRAKARRMQRNTKREEKHGHPNYVRCFFIHCENSF